MNSQAESSHDGYLMMEFRRSKEWECLRKYVAALQDDSLVAVMSRPMAEVEAERAKWQAYARVLGLPDWIVERGKSVQDH